jgi:hypothetical protein
MSQLYAGERRVSPRVPAKFRVRPEGAEVFEDASGDLGLNGVRWDSPRTVAASRVEVKLSIPGVAGDVVAVGHVVGRRRGQGVAHSYGVKFTELPVNCELSLARYLHEVSVGWE